MIQSRLMLLPCPRPCSSILFLQPVPSLVMDQFWELLARELTMRFGLLGWKALSAWGRVLQALIWQGICDWACKGKSIAKHKWKWQYVKTVKAQKKTLEFTPWSWKSLRVLMFFECCFDMQNHFSKLFGSDCACGLRNRWKFYWFSFCSL